MADSRLFLLVLALCLLWLAWLSRQREASQAHPAVLRPTLQRLLKRRTPDDCPACRQQRACPIVDRPTRSVIHPWSEVKSHRGAPKHIDTQGFAGDNRACVYFGVTDAQVHALVGVATHGKCEPIQTFCCQACGNTFSSRPNTALYRLKTASSRVAEVLAALAEDLDVSAAVRVFGDREATITHWLRRAGSHGESLHYRYFQNLHLPHVQLAVLC